MLLLCCFFCLCLTGCASQKSAVPKLILRYADDQPMGYPTTVAAEYFADLVRERTQGNVVVKVYDESKLGDQVSVFRQMQFGGIDFARVTVSTLAEFVPVTGVLQMPYLFNDEAHMWRVLDSELGDTLLDQIDPTGVIGLSWYDAGTRNLYTKEKVQTLDDLKGLRIRVQQSSFFSRLFRLLGAVPVQIPYDGIYSALETEEIDGAENNWASYDVSGHYEIAPYVLLDGHVRLPEAQLISQAAVEKIVKLNPAYEEIICQAARESAQYERSLWKERERASEEKMRSSGCIVTELSEEEKNRFREAVQPMYDTLPEESRRIIEQIHQIE